MTAAAIRLADGTPVALAISGISPASLFALDYFGELGRLVRPTKPWRKNDSIHRGKTLPCRPANQTIDGNFVAALANGSSVVLSSRSGSRHCATARSHRAVAATGQVVRLI